MPPTAVPDRPRVDVDELAYRRSLRASRRRREAVAARLRRVRVSRRAAAVAVAATAAVAGGAGAHTVSGGSAPRATVAKAGSSGSLVKQIQMKVGVTADGAFGPITRAAVKRFQRAHGLTPDGIAGPATLSAMGLAGAATTSAGTASSGTTRASAQGTSAPSATLQRIARCESGGDPTAVSADGLHRGKYQFTRETWRDMGGTGDPAQAPEATQDRLAAKLLAQRGTAPWPNC